MVIFFFFFFRTGDYGEVREIRAENGGGFVETGWVKVIG